MDKNLIDWYSSYFIGRKDQLQKIPNMVVADAFFSKETFITPMCENNFYVISRFRNDVVLYYPTVEKKTGKRGHPKWYDGKIDFANLDLSRCAQYEVSKEKLYGLRVYAKALKRYAGITNWQSTDFRKLVFHFNASPTAVNLAKVAYKRQGITYSISSCKSVIHNAYMLERFICVSGIKPDP